MGRGPGQALITDTGMPAQTRLGLHVGRERGLRRIHSQRPREFDATWLRLPAHALPDRGSSYHDVGLVGWSDDTICQTPVTNHLNFIALSLRE